MGAPITFIEQRRTKFRSGFLLLMLIALGLALAFIYANFLVRG